jgi:hypothetical protein
MNKEDSLAVFARERESRSSRRKRSPSILEQLIAGCDAERVAVQFVDGRVLEGALLFNPIKRSGKLINVDQEFSLDFDPIEVKEIKVLVARLPTAPTERGEARPEREPSRSHDASDDDGDDD